MRKAIAYSGCDPPDDRMYRARVRKTKRIDMIYDAWQWARMRRFPGMRRWLPVGIVTNGNSRLHTCALCGKSSVSEIQAGTPSVVHAFMDMHNNEIHTRQLSPVIGCRTASGAFLRVRR